MKFTDKEIKKLMDESEDRLIELILTRVKPSEQEEFIKDLIKDRVSKELIKKFKLKITGEKKNAGKK
jgi:hypothetical protein